MIRLAIGVGLFIALAGPVAAQDEDRPDRWERRERARERMAEHRERWRDRLEDRLESRRERLEGKLDRFSRWDDRPGKHRHRHRVRMGRHFDRISPIVVPRIRVRPWSEPGFDAPRVRVRVPRVRIDRELLRELRAEQRALRSEWRRERRHYRPI